MSFSIKTSTGSVSETPSEIQFNYDYLWMYHESELLSIFSEHSKSPNFSEKINSIYISEKILDLNWRLDSYQALYKIGWKANWFNHPFKETTLIQKMIRNGHFEFLQHLAPQFPLEEVRLSPHFTQDEFRECLVSPKSEPLSEMSVKPILVTQQGCTSIVRLKDGSNLRLPATKALELRKRILKEHRINPESRRADHVFTIYLNRNHASYSLWNNRSAELPEHYGFYPSVEPLTPISTVSCAVIDDRANGLDSSKTNELVLQFPITEAQHDSLSSFTARRQLACKNGTDSYLPLGRNCVDFVQEAFETAGFPGHFGELIDPKKLASKLTGVNGKYGLAAQYTFARVMGLTAFFLAQFTAFDFSDDYATRKILYAADILVAGFMIYLMYKCVQKGTACCSRVFRRQQS